MVIGEADDHVESKDPGSVTSGNAAAGSSPGNTDVSSRIQTLHVGRHRENALERLSSRTLLRGPSTPRKLHFVKLSLRSG